MRGSVVRRGPNRYALVYLARGADGIRKQRWTTFHGTKQQAGDRLAELVAESTAGGYVAPSKLTVGEWLDRWLDTTVAATRRPRTQATYRHVVTTVKRAIGPIPLQRLLPGDLQAFYSRDQKKAASTLRLIHNVVSAALSSAVKQGVLARNVAKLADAPKVRPRTPDDVDQNCWTEQEAKKFLKTAAAAGTRQSALYALLLDTGARIGEAAALKWSDVNLDSQRITIQRGLISAKLGADGQPQIGPTKSGRTRIVDIGPETVRRLVAHRKAQAELIMKNRLHYDDFGLVFAKEQADACASSQRLGRPLQLTNLYVEVGRLVKAAGVRRITVHGLRHTCATLLLKAGEPITIVSQRLGHAKTSITLDVYGHTLPGMGKSAAATLNGLLYG